MPQAAPRPCTRPGCGRLVPYGGACPVHPVRDNTFADARRGSRQSRGYDAEWDRLRNEIMRRDQGLCQVCLQAGRTKRAVAVDHVVSKALAALRRWPRERADAPDNLQAICRACHDAKTAADRAAIRAEGVGGV